MRRALPSIAATLLVVGLFTAAVIAAPSAEERSERRDGGPLSLMRDKPRELEPELRELEPSTPEPKPKKPGAKKPAAPREPAQKLPRHDPARPSVAVGKPWNGRLRNGVQLPAEGAGYYTYDSPLRRTPSRGWRRWATAATISRTQAVIADFAAAHPDAPRVAIGDLSRPRGGVFDRRFGGIGHASHQNGLDVDVYYPRRDRRERPPSRPSQVDRRLAQELVDRFVAAGARFVFVGPSLDLRGPRAVVQELAHHDNHLHVRWPAR